MPRPDAGTSLLELQRSFARTIRAAALASDDDATFAGPGAVPVSERLAVYRNNAWQFFQNALALTYPVLKRRVGDDYFRQLAHEYRIAHPSRRGDLHWVGESFPAWLEQRLAQTEYAWLADLARLEWACEVVATTQTEQHADIAALSALDPVTLDRAVLHLQPALQLVESSWPLWSVWQANQAQHEAMAIDLGSGPENCAVAGVDDGVTVYRLTAVDFSLLGSLQAGSSLAQAVSVAGAAPEALARLLGWAFAERLVVGVVSPSARA